MEKLIEKANALQLAEKRYWHILLHYKTHGYGLESEVDDLRFFLSPNGKSNPNTELISNLSAFFDPPNSKAQHPQCRFIARFEWLNEHLTFDKKLMPRYDCPGFNQWIANIDPTSATMIFTSYYLGDPGTMFGHTLIRINPQLERKNALLGHAIYYAADVDSRNTTLPEYVFNGVFGGYKGRFKIQPYYQTVQNYNEIQVRDIWEYDLNLNEIEVNRMMKHVWELESTHFDYFFFKENCSYQLLSLIEAARPSLHLQDDFFLWTIPIDTIKRLIAHQGIVKNTTYRPSRWNRLLQKLNLLTLLEQNWFYKITLIDTFSIPEEWQLLSKVSQARILDAINDYYSFLSTTDSLEKRQQLLKYRATLNIRLPEIYYPSQFTSPETGHDSFMVSAGAGNETQNGDFNDLIIRFSFHDLLASNQGYLPNSEIEIFKFEFREFRNTRELVIEEFVLCGAQSYVPLNRMDWRPSWKLESGLKKEKTLENGDHHVAHVNGGFGGSIDVWDGIAFSLMEIQYRNGSVYEKNYQAGGGITLGGMVNFFGNTKILTKATHWDMSFGNVDNYQTYTIGIGHTLSSQIDIRSEWKRIKDYEEIKVSTQFYF